MRIIKFNQIVNQTISFDELTVLVLGYFDGLHLGHKALFDEAKKLADVLSLKIAVLTFSEKPVLTFKQFSPEMLLKLTSEHKRYELFEQYGVDFLFLQDSTSRFAAQTSEEFVEHVVKLLHPKVVITGFDYTTGSDMVGLRSNEAFKVIKVPDRQDAGLSNGKSCCQGLCPYSG